MDVVDKAQAVIPPERYAKRVRQPLLPACEVARSLISHSTEQRRTLGAGAILPREEQAAAEVLHRTQPEPKVRHGGDGAHHPQHAVDAGAPPSLPPRTHPLPSTPLSLCSDILGLNAALSTRS